jgi:predicted RNA methylase
MDTGLNRNTIDKFYTNPKIVSLIIKNVLKMIDITDGDIVIEPSAGSGNFSEILMKKFNQVISYDVEPEQNYIVEKNFLELDIEEFKDKRIHIIGNPPFGRQSSLAKKFIIKCCQFSSSITFILPKSFKKESCNKIFDEYFHLILQQDLPKYSFLLNGNKYVYEYL